MTNGEKMVSAFPDGEVRKCEKGVVFLTGGWCHSYADEWWNAEYKEPTTKNDLPHFQHTDEEIAKSFIEDVEAVKDQLPCFCEQMDFPNTFDEFADYYGFKDTKEVYTNGSELIPVFRVKQWLEHISTTKNDLGVEQYRERMIEAFHNADCDELIAIVALPTEKEFKHLEWLLKTHYKTPQEPKTGKWISTETKGVRYAFWCRYKCSLCGGLSDCTNFCPNCGAKMVEPQESER